MRRHLLDRLMLEQIMALSPRGRLRSSGELADGLDQGGERNASGAARRRGLAKGVGQEGMALDLAHGSAGALLALLHLHRVAPDANPNGDRPLELARACAEHLLRQRVSPSGAPRAWPYEYGETPLCGLAHGASGIACALLRLHRETGDPELLAAAHEGMAYERQHYTAPPGEWQDLRDPDTRRFTTAWCHGSPGIALARLEALEFGESEDENASDFADDLDKALATTRNPELDPVDHLCCGNAGRIEVLLSAHRSLQDVSLRTEAEALERKLRRRAEGSAEESEGRYRWSEEDPEAFVPGLMVGAAGLGYTLLRLEDETALPGVLLLR